MPIYAYKCSSCGVAKDILRKISDPPLTECPACGKATLEKQVTAAGFQLKGSGWYATDFKGGTTASAATPPASTTETTSAAASTSPATPASSTTPGDSV